MGRLIGKVNQVPQTLEHLPSAIEGENIEDDGWKRDWMEIIILGSIWAALVFIIIFKT